MFDGYPLPAHVAAIWMADGHIWIAFPPVAGKSRGHKVHVPDNVEGLAWIIKLLRTRETEKEHCIASPGAPIQAQLKITEIVKRTIDPEVRKLEERERVQERKRKAQLDRDRQAGKLLESISLEDLGL